MRIAISSDMHNQLSCLDAALRHRQNVDSVLPGGDACSAPVITQPGQGHCDQPVRFVWGNDDGDQGNPGDLLGLLNRASVAFSGIGFKKIDWISGGA